MLVAAAIREVGERRHAEQALQSEDASASSLSPGQEAELEGAGLGLALGSRPAQLMGGSIDVRSVPEEGSTFTLGQPASGSPPKRAAIPEGPISPVRPGRIAV
jgi:signal transduction histidine kinase